MNELQVGRKNDLLVFWGNLCADLMSSMAWVKNCYSEN